VEQIATTHDDRAITDGLKKARPRLLFTCRPGEIDDQRLLGTEMIDHERPDFDVADESVVTQASRTQQLRQGIVEGMSGTLANEQFGSGSISQHAGEHAAHDRGRDELQGCANLRTTPGNAIGWPTGIPTSEMTPGQVIAERTLGSFPASARRYRPQSTHRHARGQRAANTTMIRATLHASRIAGPANRVHHRVQTGTHQVAQMLPPTLSRVHDSSPPLILFTFATLPGRGQFLQSLVNLSARVAKG